MSSALYKIELYVPESHLTAVKTALFEAGAGRVGNYDCCAWQTRGEGQFRPLEGSAPFLGNQGQVEIVIEYKLELVCEERCLKAAIAALKRAHPYEGVAYTAIRTKT